MQERSMIDRLTILEQKVETLETLPARVSAVEAQIVQLRSEVSAGFSALRGEMHEMGTAIRTDLRAEMREAAGSVHAEIREGDEETRRFMRVLHEDLIARIATIQRG